MIVALREKQRRPRLFYNLNQGRVILHLFLLSSFLVLFIGFAGMLQGGLGAIGAGQTELAYSIANLRNNASLKPIEKTTRFTYSTTADTDLQNYFTLDGDSGVLTLRDGLRSIAVQTNPLKSFPYQIVEAVPGEQAARVVSLYIQILNCQQFLAVSTPSRVTTKNNTLGLSEGDAILQCMDIDPVLVQASSLTKVNEGIQAEANEIRLLNTQTHEYLTRAEEILSLPKPQPNSPFTSFTWGPASAPASTTAKFPPVWRVFILQDKAEPGLKIFDVANPPPAVAFTQKPGVKSRSLPPESPGARALRSLDQLFLLILKLRHPVLICLGVLAPLLAWMIHLRDKVVRRCLEPYLLLLLAQMLSLFLADALMGEGLVVWVGLIYTLLRLMQLRELFWMSRSADPRIQRLFNLRGRPWLRDLLRLQVLLWGINALGLGWHIIGVFRAFPLISPA